MRNISLLLTLVFLLCGSTLFAGINEELSKCSAYPNQSEKVLYNKKAAELISRGADVNVRDEYGTPLLGNAAYSGNYELVKVLVENNANINIKTNDTGRTPLFLAIENIGDHDSKQRNENKFQVIKYLISKGADVNIPDNYGLSCLMRARSIPHKQAETMELLISHGADVNAKDKEGNSMLSFAVQSGDMKKVKYLVSKGAKFDDTKPPLVYAVSSMNHDLVKYIFLQRQNGQFIDINACDENGNTPLMIADQIREECEYALKNGTLDKKTGELTVDFGPRGGTTVTAKQSELKKNYSNILKIQDILTKNGGIRLKKKAEIN